MPEELHITIRLDGGSLWATVEAFPGVFATGDDLDEVRESLEEGIALYLASPGEEPPSITLDSLEAQPVASTAHLAYA